MTWGKSEDSLWRRDLSRGELVLAENYPRRATQFGPFLGMLVLFLFCCIFLWGGMGFPCWCFGRHFFGDMLMRSTFFGGLGGGVWDLVFKINWDGTSSFHSIPPFPSFLFCLPNLLWMGFPSSSKRLSSVFSVFVFSWLGFPVYQPANEMVPILFDFPMALHRGSIVVNDEMMEALCQQFQQEAFQWLLFLQNVQEWGQHMCPNRNRSLLYQPEKGALKSHMLCFCILNDHQISWLALSCCGDMNPPPPEF